MKKPNLWKYAVAGAAGGLVASFAMNQFQALLQMVEKKIQPEKQEKPPEEDEDATVKTAQAICRAVAGRELQPAEKKPAGAIVHYAYGTVIGAAYGVLTARAPMVATGRGVAYGAAAWLGGDEIAVPAFGLGKTPSRVPAISHVKEFVAHVVYGAVTHGVFQLLARV
jgi:putative membrane protein